MLKKSASIVLASLRPSTYRTWEMSYSAARGWAGEKVTIRAFTHCGLADELFEHPAGSTPVVPDHAKQRNSGLLTGFSDAFA